MPKNKDSHNANQMDLHKDIQSDTQKDSFFGFTLPSTNIRLHIKKIAQGAKVLRISMGRLGKVTLKVPSKEEQQKIAKFLSAIDKKITTMDKQITETESFKKGLLQRMFV